MLQQPLGSRSTLEEWGALTRMLIECLPGDSSVLPGTGTLLSPSQRQTPDCITNKPRNAGMLTAGKKKYNAGRKAQCIFMCGSQSVISGSWESPRTSERSKLFL